MQQPAEIREWPADAESEGRNTHMLDRGIGEEPLDVAPSVQHESGEQQRRQSHRDHQRPGRERLVVGRQQHLEAQHRVERDVQQEPRQHRRDRRRTLGMGIRQPAMDWHQPRLGTVAEQQKYKSKVEERRIERLGSRDEHGPGHRIQTLADRRLRRDIDKDRPE